MIGVILAAGMGTRLRPLTDNNSKALLELNGCSILERMIINCMNENISSFIVVTGYYADKTRNVCEELSQKYDITIKTIKNEKYNVTNTSVSTFLVTDYLEKNNINEDIILINGDNIVDPKIIHNLVLSQNTSLVIDNVKELTQESFKLIIKEDIIKEIGKEISINESSGEFIGLSKIVHTDLIEFNKIISRIINENAQNYYDYTFKDLSEITIINYVLTDGLKWTEIDDLNDYEKAKEILSQLENS